MRLTEKNSGAILTATGLLSLGCYFLLGYKIARHETTAILLCIAALFSSYFFWLKNINRIPFKTLLLIAVVFRLVFTFSVPVLSDDFYRFIWDGELWVNGINPFSMTPREITGKFDIQRLEALFPYIYGKDYHTVYPPLAQFVFRIAAAGSANILTAVLWLRLFVFIFEAGTIWLLWRLLKEINLPVSNLFLYALNPLIILEFSGNLHHEGYLIFFLTLTIWFLKKNNFISMALAFSGAVVSKLLPLIFLPALILKIPRRQRLIACSIIFLITATGFFLMGGSEVLFGMTSGLSLYFQKFEFNPSMWYLVRAAGNFMTGWNIIGYAGPVMGLIATCLIFYFSFHAAKGMTDENQLQKLTDTWSIVLTCYLVFSTTVHPWYITPLIFFSVFSNFRFSLIWSALIMLTYSGYDTVGYAENPLIPAIEYLVVFSVLIFEWTRLKNQIV